MGKHIYNRLEKPCININPTESLLHRNQFHQTRLSTIWWASRWRKSPSCPSDTWWISSDGECSMAPLLRTTTPDTGGTYAASTRASLHRLPGAPTTSIQARSITSRPTLDTSGWLMPRCVVFLCIELLSIINIVFLSVSGNVLYYYCMEYH